ncbi:ABC transporter permease [Hydrogenobaculum acidophilum]
MWFLAFTRGTLVILEIELRKMIRQKIDILTRAVQPLIWILLFGNVFKNIKSIPIKGDYLSFMTPGILAQSVMFVSFFYGISLIWDKDQGQITRFLSAPIPYSSIATGKAIFSGVRSLIQAFLIMLLSKALDINIFINFYTLIFSAIVIILSGVCFASFSMLIASVFKNVERFMSIIQIITMPIFFSSSALYPISLMPKWLKVVAFLNPLTYSVEGLRILLYQNSLSIWFPLLVLSFYSVAFLVLSAFSMKSLVN